MKTDSWKPVGFTKESWKALVQRYEQAVINKEDEFVFEGETYLTAFAKRFIEYHGPKFSGRGSKNA